MGTLPSFWEKAKARSKVSSLVAMVRTTSTSFITGTGLKKWSPTNRSARSVWAAMSVMVSELVFDAKMVSGPHRPSSSPKSAFFTSRSSTMASMTISHGARSATLVVKVRRASAASRSSAEIFSLETARSRDFSMRARPLSAEA